MVGSAGVFVVDIEVLLVRTMAVVVLNFVELLTLSISSCTSRVVSG